MAWWKRKRAKQKHVEILSKDDARKIFSMTENQWVANVQGAAAAGRAGIMGSRESGLAMAMKVGQDRLIVKSNYGKNKTQPDFIQVTVAYSGRRASLLSTADLTYSVKVAKAQMAPEYEVIGNFERVSSLTTIHFVILKAPHARLGKRHHGRAAEGAKMSDADRAAVWVPWYFKRGAYTVITAPLFALFAIAVIIAIFGAILQGFALIRVSYAVWGPFGLLAVLFVGWIPLSLPPALYYWALKNLPGTWIRTGGTRTKTITSIVVTIALLLTAHLIFRATGLGIGWIADQDPCAAIEAGVTGSVIPTNCP